MYKDMYDFSVSVKAPVWKNRLDLSMSLYDLFYTNNYQVDVKYADQHNGFKEQNETRLFSLNLTYNFGSQKKKKRKVLEKSNVEETDRLLK